jgi:hypothetical protein
VTTSPPPRGFPPGAYLIGAQKSATTTFADLLAQHPDVVLSRPKEPDYFTGAFARGADWYAERFTDHAGVLLDASMSYTLCPFPARIRTGDPLVGVPERIHAQRPDARFLYVLRDPVARAWSAYWHAVRRGYERRSPAAALTAESGYLAASSYGYQLERYLEVFEATQFLLIDMTLFIERQDDVMRACLHFLGVPAHDVRFQAIGARNRSFTYSRTGTAVRRLVGGERMLKRASGWARRTLPAGWRDRLARAMTNEIPPLDDANRAVIRARLDPAQVEIRPRPGLTVLGRTPA